MNDDKLVNFMLGIMPAFFFLSILFLGQRKNLSKHDFFGLVLLFACSILTIKLALFLNMKMFSETSLHFDINNLKIMFFASFLGVGMNEEGAKIIPLLILLYLSPRWRTTQDIYFACICVGACFAGIENVVVESYSQYSTNLVLRNLLAVPAHLSFACLMAPFLVEAVRKKDFELNKNRTVAFLLLLIEVFLAFGVFYWLKANYPETSYKRSFIKLSFVVIVAMFIIHFFIKMKNKRNDWFAVFYDTGFILLAIVVPATLHGCHDFIIQIFTGIHSLVCQLAFIFTYFAILLHTFFYMNSIPMSAKILYSENDYLGQHRAEERSSL